MLQWSMGSERLLATDQMRVNDSEVLSEDTSALSCHRLVILENLNDGDRQDGSSICMKARHYCLHKIVSLTD